MKCLQEITNARYYLYSTPQSTHFPAERVSKLGVIALDKSRKVLQE